MLEIYTVLVYNTDISSSMADGIAAIFLKKGIYICLKK